MMKIKSFVFNDFQENTYILYDESGECMIVDPGCYHTDEKEKLKSFIGSNQLKPVLLFNTHCHIDHILGNRFVADEYHLPLHLHEKELVTYEQTSRWGEMFGLQVNEIPEKLVFVNELPVLTFGNTSLELLFTPGHSIASITLVEHQLKAVICGDVLFNRSVGRTDLPGGDFNTLKNSILTKLFTLPDDYVVYPGHGLKTTIGDEKKYNPFLT